jgi:S-DNA-T family DNA segregation ATPase FtsK/SpoIIIE
MKKKHRKSYKTALEFILMAGLVFLLFSCLSFDIADWPSEYVYPHNAKTQNSCGTVGAFAGYYTLKFLGPGCFVILLSGIFFLLLNLIGKDTHDLWLRAVGLALLTAAASATFYFFWPQSLYEFPQGSGGILGTAVTEFLRGHFALLGTFLLLGCTWIVGLVLLADTLVMQGILSLGRGLQKLFGFTKPLTEKAHTALGYTVKLLSYINIKCLVPALGGAGLTLESDRGLENSLSAEQSEPTQNQDTNNFSDKPFEVRRKETVHPDKPYVPKSYEDYQLPPLDLLEEPEYGYTEVQKKVVKSKAKALEDLLEEFNINAKVVAADTGPVVTMFELELAAGIKVSQIRSLCSDIARALGASAVRVVAPLTGKHTIGIEVPNNQKEKVRIKDLMRLAGSAPEKMQIPLFIGKDSSGQALVSDLAQMPHLLVAGTTGSGKSVCINSVIAGILLTRRPDEVKMIMIDPKMVEMAAFTNIPHLMSPVITEVKKAVQVLEWASTKMDERYALLAEARVKNISQYNKLEQDDLIERFEPSTPEEEAKIPKKLSYIVIIIDELADLMMTASKEIEGYIVRLAQKSRAVGIHIIMATQRPQATVVTGLIKSNLPARIGFRVAARMDSRIILDQNGAETLLGQGDMLFLKPGTSELVRSQGTFVDDTEIRRIVRHLKEVAEPQFHPELMQLGKVDTAKMQRDEMFDDAVEIVMQTKRGSVSLLQRRLSIGYARASRIIEMMAAAGILGEYKGSQAREVLMTRDEWENIKKGMQRDAAAGYKDLQQDDEQNEEDFKDEAHKEYMAIEQEQQ